MKTYIQYLWNSPLSGKLIEPCGSDAVIRLDGRETIESWHAIALRESTRRMKTYDGYRIIQGNSLLTAKPITNDYKLT